VVRACSRAVVGLTTLFVPKAAEIMVFRGDGGGAAVRPASLRRGVAAEMSALRVNRRARGRASVAARCLGLLRGLPPPSWPNRTMPPGADFGSWPWASTCSTSTPRLSFGHAAYYGLGPTLRHGARKLQWARSGSGSAAGFPARRPGCPRHPSSACAGAAVYFAMLTLGLRASPLLHRFTGRRDRLDDGLAAIPQLALGPRALAFTRSRTTIAFYYFRLRSGSAGGAVAPSHPDSPRPCCGHPREQQPGGGLR